MTSPANQTPQNMTGEVLRRIGLPLKSISPFLRHRHNPKGKTSANRTTPIRKTAATAAKTQNKRLSMLTLRLRAYA